MLAAERPQSQDRSVCVRSVGPGRPGKGKASKVEQTGPAR
jgi:hypothetical protein